MGRVISQCVKERTDCEISVGIDINGESTFGYPIYTDFSNVSEQVDVIIDFSHPKALSPLLAFAKEKQVPCVLCTTGYSTEQVEELKKISESVPIFYSRNMSLGINLLIALSQKAAAVLGNEFDIEIIEMHHNQKIDAPSGTALMLADGIAQIRGKGTRYVYDRHSQRKKREQNEIGLHSVRGGTIVGEHEVIFAGPHEVISLSHSAQSKEVFANGAINAAVYMAGRSPGLYDMSDLLK